MPPHKYINSALLSLCTMTMYCCNINHQRWFCYGHCHLKNVAQYKSAARTV